jgi:hypothetical protein
MSTAPGDSGDITLEVWYVIMLPGDVGCGPWNHDYLG